MNASLFRRLVRYESMLWVLVILAVVVLRWPFLKGLYYRTAHVSSPAGTIEWRSNLNDALAEASRTGQPVLVDFSASWCPPCIAMKHDVWSDPEVGQAVMTAFIPVAIDIDQDPEAANRFGITAIPAVLVLEGNGEVIRREGFLTAADVIRLARPRATTV